jgi:hypothetical protein
VMRLSIGGVASRQAMCPRSGILIDMIGDVVFSDFGARLICVYLPGCAIGLNVSNSNFC